MLTLTCLIYSQMESNGPIIADEDLPQLNGPGKLEEKEVEEFDKDGDLVTPWDVTASSNRGVDYDKLICKRLSCIPMSLF